MVKLEKPLNRIVRCDSSWAKANQIILTVYPHGELGFREPRRRAEYRLSLPEALRQAVVTTTYNLQLRVRELRKQGRTLAQARKQARRELL